MATANSNIHGVIGYFETRSQAERAIEDLKAAGFRAEQIGLATSRSTLAPGSAGETSDSIWDRIVRFFDGNNDAPNARMSTDRELADRESDTSYDSDYDSNNFRNSLQSMGSSEQSARYFEHKISASGAIGEGTLVTVRAQGREPEAQEILRRNGADIGGNADSFDYPETSTQPAQAAQSRRIQLLGEVLRVHKESVSRGEVRIRKEVVTENQTIEVPVSREELVIERVTGQAGAPAGEIGADSEIRIPLTEERVTTEKRPIVREEVEIGKRRVSQTQRVSDDVRHEELRVEEDGQVETAQQITEKERLQRKKTA